jgi:hypothetical protein
MSYWFTEAGSKRGEHTKRWTVAPRDCADPILMAEGYMDAMCGNRVQDCERSYLLGWLVGLGASYPPIAKGGSRCSAGRTASAADAIAQVGDASPFEHPDPLQLAQAKAQIVEQAASGAEQHRNQVDLELVD